MARKFITPTVWISDDTDRLDLSNQSTILPSLNEFDTSVSFASFTDPSCYFLLSTGDADLGVPTGQQIAFKIQGINHLVIDETAITPAVPFANLKTTGLIQGSQGTLASATNVATPTTNLVLITGTTTMVTMGVTGVQAGTRVVLRFGSAVQLNHDSGGGNGRFFMGGGVNRSAAAGSRSTFVLTDLGGTLYWLETSYLA